MIPFFHIDEKREPTRQENMRAFWIVFYLLLAVGVMYIFFSMLAFGHL